MRGQELNRDEPRERARLAIRGAVQGVGFRPFVFRLATGLGLDGWVVNSSQGVTIEIEGEPSKLRQVLLGLETQAPPRAFIQSLETTFLEPAGHAGFQIRESRSEGPATALVLPDIATCSDCRREILDPSNRRFRYPFTNCTNCGPRFSIIAELPYDRPNTTMRGFVMCEACRAEYENPLDRRFHAQPNACPACGPALSLVGPDGTVRAIRDEALLGAEEAIRAGAVVAVKGLGGFHLIVDARNEEAVSVLRRRKGREEKPFALMYPSLEAIAADCEVDALERRLLEAPEAPIVLLRRKNPGTWHTADNVAPGNPYLGVMLPYTPLHHLLMGDLGFPLVATSGNRSEEPICTDEVEALDRLTGLADLFLVHDRPIERHVDDSVARIVLGRELVLRRARGYAPLPVPLGGEVRPMLAVGAHLKNTVAVTAGSNAFLSQHIGDLETPQAFDAFRAGIESMRHLYRVTPVRVACDLHPGYLSTAFARTLEAEIVPVQHHLAHVLACMAENQVSGPVLGVSWDGTGLGTDGKIWGGEFLDVEEAGWKRVVCLREFTLPGGDQAVREPRRAALGVLYEVFGERTEEEVADLLSSSFARGEVGVLLQMISRGINAARTSSAGRLFDAVAWLVNRRSRVRYEAQAAIELEFSAGAAPAGAGHYPIAVGEEARAADSPGVPAVVDWEPTIRAILEEVRGGIEASLIAARFHNSLVESIVDVARRVGREKVVLTGGCFQNRYLLEHAVKRLEEEGFRPCWHQRVPPNDGGIALGQLVAAARDCRML